MAFQKGHKKLGGKKKGQQNRTTVEIKDMIRGALDAAGGLNYLKAQSKENPTAFMTLIGKIIPADVHAKVQGDITFKWADE